MASYASEDTSSDLHEGKAPSPGSTNRSAEEITFGLLVTTTYHNLLRTDIFSNAFRAE